MTMNSAIAEFVSYPKTPRLFREIVVTEKLDGTNSCIYIDDSGGIRAGSRNRWITPTDDNFGFAKWVEAKKLDLLTLGPGRHFGEWFGQGIQRNYGLKERRFALFNVARWADGATKPILVPGSGLQIGEEPLSPRPPCCGVVPVLYRGPFDTAQIRTCLNLLDCDGSIAVPGWSKPEGVVIFHTAANRAFKVLLENDGEAKGE